MHYNIRLFFVLPVLEYRILAFAMVVLFFYVRFIFL